MLGYASFYSKHFFQVPRTHPSVEHQESNATRKQRATYNSLSSRKVWPMRWWKRVAVVCPTVRRSRTRRKCRKHCLSGPRFIRHTRNRMTILTGEWKWMNTVDTKQFLMVFLLRSKHKSGLSIYFKEKQFIASHRSELYGPTEFLANCGGLLGLFMGMSILSIVEIIYFCSLRLVCSLKSQRKYLYREQIRNEQMINGCVRTGGERPVPYFG